MINKRRTHCYVWLQGLCLTLSLLCAMVNAQPAPPLLQLAQANQADQLKKQNLLNADSIAVIYPESTDAYREFFTKIVEGVELQTKARVRTIALTEKQESAEVYAQLKRSGTKVVIALGSRGLKIASGFDRDIAVVVGGVLTIQESENSKLLGIALTPDPALLFRHVKELIPAMKRVIVIYDPKKSEWLLKFARLAAKEQGIELVGHEAQDLASAARLYESVFASADPKTDTIWLPQDETTVDEGTILPIVLRESWTRNVPFFSSKFIHVKKGALFSLRPNNLELGGKLAVIAMNILGGDSSKRGMVPLRDVQTALNVRTAMHIGLNIGSQQQRNFNYIFPEQ